MTDRNSTLTPRRINHYAIATNDMEATHKFWTEVMNCEFKAAIRVEGHPMSTGEIAPGYLHAFYSFEDGACIAFFELATPIDVRSDGVPAWAKHLALSVESHDELKQWHSRLTDLGVDVVGEVDHGGLFYSLYFVDPNGQRVELTYQTRSLDDDDIRSGHETLKGWASDKNAGVLV
ncbi:VOC family protein [Rhodococcus opacus]|uniref:VOC family protein n=1 Tax=Rhodococcus opacus TaxID=37919 RepID=UPI00155AC39A|nr:VOC family protein [Rhodococcus opacus]